MTEVKFGSRGYESIGYSDLTSIPQPRRALLGARERLQEPNQFTLFQIGDNERPIIELTGTQPTAQGSDEKPDIDASISLQAFHFDEALGDEVGEKSRATLRFDLGQDERSSSPLEPLMWSIAAGLDLYDHFKAGKTNANDPSKMNDNFSNKFRRRPIEIAGELGKMRLEVIMHKEPPWWRQILRFGQTDTAKRLVATLGFPGLALDALNLVDEMISRFEDAGAKPIISSRPLTLAFSKYARDEFTGGAARTLIGCVGNGHYILCKQGDAKTVLDLKPLFIGTNGLLVPQKAWEESKGSGRIEARIGLRMMPTVGI